MFVLYYSVMVLLLRNRFVVDHIHCYYFIAQQDIYTTTILSENIKYQLFQLKYRYFTFKTIRNCHASCFQKMLTFERNVNSSPTGYTFLDTKGTKTCTN